MGSRLCAFCFSGAGKSTLMTALAYRHSGTTEIDGDILVNGRPIGSYMKYLSGYMHQEDLFVPSLTVMEHMNIMVGNEFIPVGTFTQFFISIQYAANLKLDRRVAAHEKRGKICKLLTELGLIKCVDTRIGGAGHSKALSGGEKKRLAFATESLTDPPVLFCDEPTTGLDSYSAQKLVMMMNRMATNGKTILCTIHQPSSEIFAMFSQMILVAEGRIAYMGATARAIDFFEELGYTCPSSYSPADFFIKLIASTPGCESSSKQTIKRICDQFAISDYAKEVEVVVQYEFHMGRAVMPTYFKTKKNFKELNWWWKLYWLTYRWFLEVLRNPAVQSLKILQRIIIGVIVGLCYLGTNPYTQNGIQAVQGAIFMFVSENTFNPMYAVLAEFPENAPIFFREYRSGLYHPFTYYLSRIIALVLNKYIFIILPGFVLEPVLFVVIAYWLADLRPTVYAFFMTLLITILTMNVASACGIMFSNAFDSVPSAMAYLVPFDYILMVMSGLFIKLSTLSSLVTWTKYLSWLMYATESLTIVQWSGVTNIKETEERSLPEFVEDKMKQRLDTTSIGIVPDDAVWLYAIKKDKRMKEAQNSRRTGKQPWDFSACDSDDTDLPCITEGRGVLETYSFSEDRLQRDMWSMAVLVATFYVIGYLCLWRRVRNK
ncbi:hypothetical protein NQ318_009082 [Aromia moschata]|uniref:ABC transporter domain-containing protein n=1 Tax=Aromia moschata TaxID=1265417 RepID=A0AAV8YUM7_9CUCU|nr:hypothetical protein NQ318_009082 [Aromia moschata]